MSMPVDDPGPGWPLEPEFPDGRPGERNLGCRECNYDLHRCRGCGEPIPCGAPGCEDCMLGGHGR